MKRYLAYFKYVLRHKWFVMLECFRQGLICRGIVHDMSKLFPSEFIPYAKFFYDKNGISQQHKRRDKTGYYKPYDTGDRAFDFAWLLHQKRNRHHWQWWILPKDDGGLKALQIPMKYLKEMICDWIGAGMAQGHGRDITIWYQQNRNKMKLHPTTRIVVDFLIAQEANLETRK